MIDKTRLGIEFFDKRFGGIYRKRTALCVGRKNSGKTILALQSLMQSVKEGERGLMLSAWRAPDLTILAGQLGLALPDAISKGQVVLLEYGDIMPTPEFEKNLILPPGSFSELKEIIESNSIRRVVIDTVLPWVAIPQEEKLAGHIHIFIHALEQMGVTSLLTMPKPVSRPAFTLRNRLEEQIPIVFTLDHNVAGHHSLLVNKYLGEPSLPPPTPFVFATGSGIVQASETPSAAPVPAAPGAPSLSDPIKFSSVFKRDGRSRRALPCTRTTGN